MIWILGCAILFFTLLTCGLLLKNTPNTKGIYWLLGIISFFSIVLYLFYGHPFLPDHPYDRIQKISTPKKTIENFDKIKIQQELVQHNPKNDRAWFELGNLYQQTKQFYKAALTYREAWKLNTKSYKYKFAYTQALLFFDNMKLSHTTTKLLNELHQANPKDPRILTLMQLSNQHVG